MADHFSQNFKQSFSLEDIDPGFEFMNQFSGLNPIYQDTSGLNFLTDNFSSQLSFPGLFIHEENSVMPSFSEHIISSENDQKDRKRKAMDITTPESSSANSSVYSTQQSSDNGIRKTNRGRGKKVRGNEKVDEKPREVIHVRARRGQATDSHSLAERARRGKINERLRCLQDIVPGCYKTMGMAVMLDEIINYVQSLQNQVEFLSMKLTAASTFHDFNSDIDVLETMQRAKAVEALKVQNVASPQFGQSGLNFGCYPQLPHSR